jgi:hypothetical protein
LAQRNGNAPALARRGALLQPTQLAAPPLLLFLRRCRRRRRHSGARSSRLSVAAARAHVPPPAAAGTLLLLVRAVQQLVVRVLDGLEALVCVFRRRQARHVGVIPEGGTAA